MTQPTRRGPTGLWPHGPWENWTPLEELQNLRGEMGRLLNQLPIGAPTQPTGTWRPTAYRDDSDDAFTVRVELPGIPRDDIHVEATGQHLDVTGETDEQHTGRARRSGRFAYRTRLPAGADPERATADLRDGVLTVRLPKTSRPARQITINTD